MVVNIFKPELNSNHFADDIFNAFFNEIIRILIDIKTSLNFVPMGPNESNSALIQVIAQYGTDNKPPSKPMMV